MSRNTIETVPNWELEAMAEVSIRWEINGTEAENFLVSQGVLE